LGTEWIVGEWWPFTVDGGCEHRLWFEWLRLLWVGVGGGI